MKKHSLFLSVLFLLSGESGFATTPEPSNRFDCLVEPNQIIEIRSPVVGLIQDIKVRRGDIVHAGQVIATLEQSADIASTELALFKSTAVGAAKTAQTKFKFAKLKSERLRAMQAENFTAAQESEDAEVEMKLAELEMLVAKENQQIAKLEWEQQSSLLKLKTMISPFDGIVSEQQLNPGEVVDPGGDKNPILKLAELNPLRVRIVLPFSVFYQVKLDMEVEVVPESPLSDVYKGKVKMVDRLIDASSGTFTVFVELPNDKLEIPAGIKCSANFPFSAVDGLIQPGG